MEALADFLGLTERQAYLSLFMACSTTYLLYRLSRLIRWIAELRASAGRIDAVKRSPVVFAEREVVGFLGDVRVRGRIDEIRRLPNGVMVVGDIKARNAATVSDDDIVELSLYRSLLLQSMPGQRVSSQGYIRIVNPDTGAESYEEVDLFSDAWAETLGGRFHEVKSGSRQAKKNTLVSVCGKCEFVRDCYPRLSRRGSDDGLLNQHDGFSRDTPYLSGSGFIGEI